MTRIDILFARQHLHDIARLDAPNFGIDKSSLPKPEPKQPAEPEPSEEAKALEKASDELESAEYGIDKSALPKPEQIGEARALENASAEPEKTE